MRLLLLLITVCLLCKLVAAEHNVSVIVITDPRYPAANHTWRQDFTNLIWMKTDPRLPRHRQWIEGLIGAYREACPLIQWFIVLNDEVDVFPYGLLENPAMMVVFVGGVLLSRALMYELMQSRFEQCIEYTDTGVVEVDLPVCIIQKAGLKMTSNKVVPY